VQKKRGELSDRNLEASEIPPPHLRNRVLDLSARDVVLHLGRNELPLQQNVHGSLERGEAKPDSELQRAASRAESGSGQERKGGERIEPKKDLPTLDAPAPEKTKAEQMLGDLKAKHDAESTDLTQKDVDKAVEQAKITPTVPPQQQIRRKRKYENDWEL